MTNFEYVSQCEKNKIFVTFSDLNPRSEEYIELYKNNDWFKKSCIAKHNYLFKHILKYKLFDFAAATDILSIVNTDMSFKILLKCLSNGYITDNLLPLYRKYYKKMANDIYISSFQSAVTYLQITPYQLNLCRKVLSFFPEEQKIKIIEKIKDINNELYTKLLSYFMIEKLQIK